MNVVVSVTNLLSWHLLQVQSVEDAEKEAQALQTPRRQEWHTRRRL